MNYEFNALKEKGFKMRGGVEPTSGLYAIQITMPDGQVLPQLIYPGPSLKDKVKNVEDFKSFTNNMIIQAYSYTGEDGVEGIAYMYLAKGAFLGDEIL